MDAVPKANHTLKLESLLIHALFQGREGLFKLMDFFVVDVLQSRVVEVEELYRRR